MSDPDDKALDEYLRHGSEVSQRYREISTDVVPPELDRRVLEQARAAITSSKSRRRAWARWSAPLALAASAVLALAVVIESGVQQEAAPEIATQMQREQQAKPALDPAQERAAAQSDTAADAESRLSSSAADLQSAAPSAAVAAPAPVEARDTRDVKPEGSAQVESVTTTGQGRRGGQESVTPVAVIPDTLTTIASREAVADQPPAPPIDQSIAEERAGPHADPSAKPREATARRGEYPRAFPAPAASASPVHADVEEVARAQRQRDGVPSAAAIESRPAPASAAPTPAQYPDPERWLEEIRRLRAAGRSEEADRAWRRFEAAFPQHVVAPDDAARMKTR